LDTGPFAVSGPVATLSTSVAEIALWKPAAWAIMPAAIASRWPIDHTLAPSIAVADARIVRPLDHHSADNRTRAVDNWPFNDHDPAHDRASHNPFVNNVVVIVSAIPVPIASMGRGCAGREAE
jgi:hypothetical protein